MMNRELFGLTPINEVTLSNVRLPRHPIKLIDHKKLKSLAKKYHAIPSQYMHYYPDISSIELIDTDSDASDDSNTTSRAKTLSKKGKGKVSKSATQKTKKKKKRPRSVKIQGVATSKVVGRPKNYLTRDLSQPTIMAIFEK